MCSGMLTERLHFIFKDTDDQIEKIYHIDVGGRWIIDE